MYLAGLDVGQVVDYMALLVAQPSERARPPTYTVRFAYRWPLSTPNIIMIHDIKAILSALKDHVTLHVDYTGKGQVYQDWMEREFLKPPRVTNVMADYAVFSHQMKENLVSNVKLLLGEGRLRFSKGSGIHAEMVDELFDELCNYQVRVKETARGKPTSEMGALGYGQHDDLATALMLSLMDAEYNPASGEMIWIHH